MAKAIILASMNSRDLINNLDQELDHKGLADKAGYSVAQTYRRVKREGLLRPLTTRRRILLERAAYHLVRSTTSIGELAMLSGFDSPDGFTRAFRRHYGVSPKQYRQLQASEYRCGDRGGIHYQPGALEVHRQGESMSFVTRLLESHKRETLEIIATLQRHPEICDTLLPLTNPFPWHWEPDDETVAQLASRCATGPEPWLHSIDGYSPDKSSSRLEDLRTRLEEGHRRFMIFVNAVEQDGTWETTFVDADCEPPQVFSYSSVIHHVISFNEHARITLMQRLRAMNLDAPEGLPPQI